MTIIPARRIIDYNDPCDEWPILLVPGVAAQIAAEMIKAVVPPSIMTALTNDQFNQFASGGTFTAQPYQREAIAVMGEAGPEAIMPRHVRDPGKSMFPQALRCLHDQHAWTHWGPFTPVYPQLKHGTPMRLNDDDPPQFVSVQAYRWRHCQCGAAERESHEDHTIKRFEAGDQR